jgi:hypothetical protein
MQPRFECYLGSVPRPRGNDRLSNLAAIHFGQQTVHEVDCYRLRKMTEGSSLAPCHAG